MFTLKQKKVKIKRKINRNWTLITGHLIGGYLMEVQLYAIFMKKIKNFKRNMALQNDHTSKMDLSCWCCFKKF